MGMNLAKRGELFHARTNNLAIPKPVANAQRTHTGYLAFGGRGAAGGFAHHPVDEPGPRYIVVLGDIGERWNLALLTIYFVKAPGQ